MFVTNKHTSLLRHSANYKPKKFYENTSHLNEDLEFCFKVFNKLKMVCCDGNVYSLTNKTYNCTFFYSFTTFYRRQRLGQQGPVLLFLHVYSLLSSVWQALHTRTWNNAKFGWVFNFKFGRFVVLHELHGIIKRPCLELKTWSRFCRVG
jgi:hypothetical protein